MRIAFFCYETNQHHESDLEVDIVFEPANPYAEVCAQSCHRQRENYGYRHSPTLVERRKEKKYEEQGESQHKCRIAAFFFLLIRKTAPLESNVFGQMLGCDFFQSVHGLSGAVSRGRLAGDGSGGEHVEAFHVPAPVV